MSDAPPPYRRHLVVIGLMGAGKSSVARPLAAAVDRPLLDNDDVLEARTGMTAGAYQEAHGQDALHREELAILRQCLDHTTASVITAAASVVDTEAGRQLLGTGPLVVWVDADPAVLAKRVADDDGHRPGHPDEASLTEQRRARHDHFVAVADLVVRTDESKSSAAAEVIRWARRMHLEAPG
jgi:shikimate kinase